MFRFAVIFSVFGHVALVWAMVRLPAPPMRPTSQLVEMDIRAREAKPAAHVVEPPKPLTPLPLTKPTSRPIGSVEPKVVPIAPMTTAPENTAPGSTQAAAPERDLSHINLNLSTAQLPMSPDASVVGTVKSKAPWHPRGDAGDPLLGKLAEVKGEEFPLESLGRDGFIYKGPNFSAHISMDGSVRFEDKSIGFNKGSLGGTFDLTDIIMKKRHEDPYRYQKEKFMGVTQKRRDEMRAKAHAEELQNALAELPWSCEHIWMNRTRTASERRHELYNLWRDTENGGDPKMTEEARKVVIRYIQRYLPADNIDAFTDSEIASFNNGKGPKFNPYD